MIHMTESIQETPKKALIGPEELNLIRDSFISGKRMKTIADETGRSVSAINKILTRYAIRKKGITKKAAIGRNPANDNFIKKIPANRNVYLSGKKLAILETPIWVNFSEVINFLRENGCKIEQSKKNPIIIEKEHTLCINGTNMTRLNILRLANKLRVDSRQPVFSVGGLTW